jgi:hypothetical protein
MREALLVFWLVGWLSFVVVKEFWAFFDKFLTRALL